LKVTVTSMMFSPEMSFDCPFCHHPATVRTGEFPYVRTQLVVFFERCSELPRHMSRDEVIAAADEMADELLAARSASTALALLITPCPAMTM
jgi:hypothetical protein